MNAFLSLADGTTIMGKSTGAVVGTNGEVVFSTGMTGYEQSLTDPSFAGQILVFTYPLIGNYGVPKFEKLFTDLYKNCESGKIWVKGVVMAESCAHPSHATSVQTFASWLHKRGIPLLTGVDTRALTQHLRERGVMSGTIHTSKTPPKFPAQEISYVQMVSTKKISTYTPDKPNGKVIALVDCGVKHGIMRALLSAGITVHRVPFDYNPLDLDAKLDGVVVSNGPGDPKECTKTVENIAAVLATGMPYLGICLGHQLLSLAIGSDTYKLPYGHRGFNQPCQDLGTKRAFLTSQNHGYAVDRGTIPKGYEEWFVNLNDGTNEGIRNDKKKIYSVQFHPEGEPGPFDTNWIFSLL